MANNPFIDKVLVEQLRTYFAAHPDQYDELREIITNHQKKDMKTALPSLRGLEFVTTHMSRVDAGAGFYIQLENGEVLYIDIHNAYKTALGDYKKQRFDSFRRTKLISFSIPSREDSPILTTVAQLRWGQWIYEQHIMEWVKIHWTKVRKEMAKALRQQRLRKRATTTITKKKARVFQQRVQSGTVVIRWN